MNSPSVPQQAHWSKYKVDLAKIRRAQTLETAGLCLPTSMLSSQVTSSLLCLGLCLCLCYKFEPKGLVWLGEGKNFPVIKSMCLVLTVGNLGPRDGVIGGAIATCVRHPPSPAPAQDVPASPRRPLPPSSRGTGSPPRTAAIRRRRPSCCRPFHRSGGRHQLHTGSAVGVRTAAIRC